MQLDSLTYDNNETKIGPAPTTELCKRVLFRQSTCQLCVDVCPTDAISFPLGPAINDSCISCGLCAIACPTETFESIQNTDQMLLDLIHDQADTIINDRKLFVHCHQAETDNAQSVSVNCLGNMTENALLAMSNNGVQQLMLTTGKCSSCQLAQGRELFKQAATTYSKLSNMISQPATAATISIKTREKQKVSQASATPSRREFFRSLGNGVAKHAAKAIVDKEQQIKALLQSDDEAVALKRPSPRRELLKTLLNETHEEVSDQPIDNNLPWKKMRVDVAHCVGCGVCVNVCPTGALVKEVHDLELTRTLNYSLCNNCGVCAEACPQDVIRFEQTYSLADIVKDIDEEVARVALNACVICGEIVPVSEGEVCTTCQKRQVVPMFR